MADRILLVPLDNRPCTSRFPVQIGAIANFQVLTPPVEWLGDLKEPANEREILRWLKRESYDAVGAVVALDTIAHGGLMASRQTDTPLPEIVDNLTPLRELGIPLYGFSVITRLSAHANPEEEKPYWVLYGPAIHRYLVCRHQHALGLLDEERLADAERAVPAEIMANYLAMRERNHQLNRLMIEWAGEGIFHRLYVTADDSSLFGAHIQEREALQAFVDLRRWDDRVLIYPGADEVATVMMARLVNDQLGYSPSFFPYWSSPEGERANTMYEGGPLGETLMQQISALGGILAASAADSDCLLFVNAPEQRGGDLFLELELESGCPPKEFVEQLGLAVDMGTPAAVADLAWANGASDPFVSQMVERTDPTRLLAFGGWNTAGNTLGTVLSQASLRLLSLEMGTGDFADQETAHYRFLFERFVDDWLFQGRIRPELGTADLAKLGSAVRDEGQRFFKTHWEGRQVMRTTPRGQSHPFLIGSLPELRVSFPWNRGFEVRVEAPLHLEPIV